MDQDTRTVQRLNLTFPKLVELVPVITAALKTNFDHVEVQVADCPDLTQAPYRLAAKGICGSPRIADVGGVRYLSPVPQLMHKYDLTDIAKLMDLPDSCFLLGAGAGPYHEIGCNCELMADAFVSTTHPDRSKILSQIAKIDKDGHGVVARLDSPNLAILGNFFVSEGAPGPVIAIKVRRRTGAENFISCIRNGLLRKYRGQIVGMGGVFLVTKGNLNIHIMPDFSKEPLKSDNEVESWLKFFTFPAPMIFQSVFVSEDPGLDLRVEHSHGHSLLDENGQCKEPYGGHYHYDVSPEEVEYVAYLNVAETLFRIDRPEEPLPL